MLLQLESPVYKRGKFVLVQRPKVLLQLKQPSIDLNESGKKPYIALHLVFALMVGRELLHFL